MKTRIIAIKNNPLTFYALLGAIVFSAVFYIYCVNSAVRNAVARGAAESRLAALQTAVSELEYKYMAFENKLTLESAEALGLFEPTDKIFISRNSPGRGLSLHNGD